MNNIDIDRTITPYNSSFCKSGFRYFICYKNVETCHNIKLLRIILLKMNRYVIWIWLAIDKQLLKDTMKSEIMSELLLLLKIFIARQCLKNVLWR